MPETHYREGSLMNKNMYVHDVQRNTRNFDTQAMDTFINAYKMS